MLTMPRRRLLAGLAVAGLLAGCSSGGDRSASTGSGPAGTASGAGVVRLVTHDSFALSDTVVAEFERTSGYRLEIVKGGDAVDVVNKAVLASGKPEGDVLFGIDDNTLTQAFAADVFVPYRSSALDQVDPRYMVDTEHRVTPVDHGEVCVNIDTAHYREAGTPPPATLEDLTRPEYRDQFVVQNPASSTPGLSFLLATVARYGQAGWLDYWKRLRANGVEVVDSWEQAYNERFSGGSGNGDKPLVVSYATSPPAEVLNAGTEVTEAPTAVLVDSCYRQIEFAGVLRGAANPAGAQALVDFLLSEPAQADVPLNMYVYPVRSGTPLPEVFTKYAAVPEEPMSLDPATVGAAKDDWVKAWTDTVVR